MPLTCCRAAPTSSQLRAKIWYRALRAKEIRARKPYTMRHTFISVGLTNGVKIKWLAEYCGTSVAMIEKHYGKYLGGDSEEQLSRLFWGQK
jgi:integrase